MSVMPSGEGRVRRPDATRVPPNDLQAEESLIGAMMLSRDAIAAASEIVDADHFYKPSHGHVYEAITNLTSRGEPVDAVTVADELRRADLLEAVGGPAALISLQVAAPSTSNAAHYARIVEEHALLRRLIGVAGQIAELGYDLPEDVTKTIDHAESLVYEIAQHRVTDSMSPLRELLDGTLDRLEELYDRGESITGVPTGFTDLDDITAGLQPGALVVVGARPAMGKTSFALGMAAHAALEDGRPVLFFSLEMGRLELTQRLLCSDARVDSSRVRNGKLTEADWGKISHAIGRLSTAELWIDENPNVTVLEIRAKARRLKSRIGALGVVFVDYVQLMSGRSNAENRQVEVAEISRNLKILARELECPVVALAQLNRSLEQRADKRPMLSDLRESGCLPADTRVWRADTDHEVPIGELAASGERDIPVWSVDDDLRLIRTTMSSAFATGTRDTFELRLRSGRRVTATANHPLRTLDGWTPLGQLAGGDRVAVPRPVDGVDQPGAWVPVGVDGPHDTIPAGVWGEALDGSVGDLDLGPPRRERLGRLAEATDDKRLGWLAGSDLFWDEVVEVVARGRSPVFDATVPGTHNFVADGVVVHNSLEQDADVVMFIYRDEVYNPESPDRGTAEILVAKHRNGPTGLCRLAFLDHYTRFANMARNV